jgi:toxin CcdB
MAQFDVYENPNPATRETVPFLLDVQADLLSHLSTRVVVPLVSASVMAKAAKYLNPCFEIRGSEVVMSTAELAGVALHDLGEKASSLKEKRHEIVAALDFLVIGF